MGGTVLYPNADGSPKIIQNSGTISAVNLMEEMELDNSSSSNFTILDNALILDRDYDFANHLGNVLLKSKNNRKLNIKISGGYNIDGDGNINFIISRDSDYYPFIKNANFNKLVIEKGVKVGKWGAITFNYPIFNYGDITFVDRY